METLAVKYRPKDFDEVVGQERVVAVLRNQLKNNDFVNAYLFSGPAGTGKTTIARIFAKALNKGQGTPIEINAASNNGVDDVRALIDESKYKPMVGNYKVFIIDECHMLSNSAWNAMLKLLEEPPSQTIFLFCTTDPQKIPATIISRVQRFALHKIDDKFIMGNLKAIIAKEKTANGAIKDIDDNALAYIVKQANGGMRDAISLMQKAMSFGTTNPTITLDDVYSCLGAVSLSTLMNVYQDILIKDVPAKELVVALEGLAKAGKDMKQVVKDFLNLSVELVKYYLTGDLALTTLPDDYGDALAGMAKWPGILSDTETIMDAMIRLSNDIKYDDFPNPMVDACFIGLKGKLEK